MHSRRVTYLLMIPHKNCNTIQLIEKRQKPDIFQKHLGKEQPTRLLELSQ